MLKIVIIDDEPNAVEVLQLQIEKYCKNALVIGTAIGGKEGVKKIKDLQPDLILLDIEMPHINGFDVLDATKDYNYKVIFTTAYNQFAIKAFKYATVDYLLKPIDIIDLQNALIKAASMQVPADLHTTIKTIINQMQTTNPANEFIALPTGDAMELLKPSEIIRCESNNNYTIVHLNNKKKVTIAKTLKDVEEKFTGLSFVRVHQSHLVNLDFIYKLYKGDNAYITLKNQEQIPVSRAKKEELMEYLRKL
jgi:two-component system, LytTR family, response regulator